MEPLETGGRSPGICFRGVLVRRRLLKDLDWCLPKLMEGAELVSIAGPLPVSSSTARNAEGIRQLSPRSRDMAEGVENGFCDEDLDEGSAVVEGIEQLSPRSRDMADTDESDF